MFMEKLNCDEVIAQLLATEGFATIEEVAYVDLSEIAQIEGFTEESAETIQNQAREHLAQVEAERDKRRRELGVADELAQVEGVTTAMMVAFGEHGIKTLEDLADCATDELVGWTERKPKKDKEKEAETIRHKGILEGFEVGRQEAEALILNARVQAGWIKPEDLPQPEAAADGEAAEGEPTAADDGTVGAADQAARA
jgi:N utilization substance protein A